MAQYPEHEKLKALEGKNDVIGAFIEWMQDEKGWTITETWPEGYYPVRRSIPDIIADYFGIDRDKLEAEKSQMLEELRNAQRSA